MDNFGRDLARILTCLIVAVAVLALTVVALAVALVVVLHR